ncbi:hypothetical protein DSW25_05680 [Sulfitobacter donghicola DSW-25 = KCTC 12864 = JCM 14565]|uniref:Uncharacterized protein n=1 Tax=Sulfitobacter donghicola DSW-25 = KCTC 12864 = JCM 14565 TaxID=1300350 RepID=A0A073IY32_9RHOB|nr:hypothetical protein DSW25_05680 [Sulfitobacter donghicola DSW-25 = KCTC 12864 = JCM 14565]
MPMRSAPVELLLFSLSLAFSVMTIIVDKISRAVCPNPTPIQKPAGRSSHNAVGAVGLGGGSAYQLRA